MYKIHCLNKISPIGLSVLTPDYQLTDHMDQADAVLVRSASMHELALGNTVLAVARAGAGVNNIPLENYAKQGIVVFNTPGANANAVAELTLAGMLLASRDIHGGISWVEKNHADPEIAKTVEKAKAQFGGTEIYQKTIGIVGLGAIGRIIAHMCSKLGLKVLAYEKFMTPSLLASCPADIEIMSDLETMYPHCDFISLNVPLIPETKHMINASSIQKMKDQVIVLNFARDALVQDDDMEEALKSKKVRRYVTDFPNPRSANMEGVIAIPHLGASTEEAEDNCAMMAAQQVMDYMELGHITNSVNFPSIHLGEPIGKMRLSVLYDLESDAALHLDKLTVMNKAQQEKKGYGVYLADLDQPIEIEAISAIPGVLRARVL